MVQYELHEDPVNYLFFKHLQGQQIFSKALSRDD